MIIVLQGKKSNIFGNQKNVQLRIMPFKLEYIYEGRLVFCFCCVYKPEFLTEILLTTY